MTDTASVGDKVRVLPSKSGQPPREGVVTGITGSMLRVRWSTGEESSFIPGPGAVTVVGRASTPVEKAAKGAKAGTKAAARKKSG